MEARSASVRGVHNTVKLLDIFVITSAYYWMGEAGAIDSTVVHVVPTFITVIVIDSNYILDTSITSCKSTMHAFLFTLKSALDGVVSTSLFN